MGVAADGIDAAANGRVADHAKGAEEDGRHDPDAGTDAEDFTDAKPAKIGRKIGDVSAVHDFDGDGIEDHQHGQRDDDGRDADEGDEDAVEQAEAGAQAEGHEHRRPDRPAEARDERSFGGDECSQDGGEKSEHRADGDIDFAGDDHQHDAAGDDGGLGAVDEEIADVAEAEEFRTADADDDQDQGDDEREAVFALGGEGEGEIGEVFLVGAGGWERVVTRHPPFARHRAWRGRALFPAWLRGGAVDPPECRCA